MQLFIGSRRFYQQQIECTFVGTYYIHDYHGAFDSVTTYGAI